MPELGRRGRVEAMLRAINEADLEKLRTLVTDDYVEEYPQSGERVRGYENLVAISTNYPGGGFTRGRVDVARARIVGDDEEYVVGPSLAVVHVSGSGDTFLGVARFRYPDDSTWYAVAFFDFRGDRIAHGTVYWAPLFEAPAWRAQWVERYEPS